VRRARADALVNLFEHSSLETRYDALEELPDGRGITAGRAGFTSATGDLDDVVRRYVAERPDSPLAAYLPALDRLAAEHRADTAGLAGFADAWHRAASDPTLRAAQDAVVDEDDYQPAVRLAAEVGARLPLTLAVLYDTAVQHGDGDDPDGLAALATEATAAAGGAPGSGVDEATWLERFLDVRRRHLAHAADPSTRAAWAATVSRVDTLRSLLDRGDVALDGPIEVVVYGDTFTVP
jgi:chitosanase